MQIKDIEAVIDQVSFPDYNFGVFHQGYDVFLMATFIEPDAITGEAELQQTRLWTFDMRDATPSSVVATCFKCVITSIEHEAREKFKYRGAAIYQPHHDVDVLAAICQERTGI